MDLKVYKDGKLVPKHQRQKVIDEAYEQRENPWGQPEMQPSKINENLNLIRWVDFIKEL